jgi:hypothetical protein
VTSIQHSAKLHAATRRSHQAIRERVAAINFQRIALAQSGDERPSGSFACQAAIFLLVNLHQLQVNVNTQSCPSTSI